MKENEFGKRNTEEQDMEKLISELKKYQPETTMFRGIVPICSFCKRIRNDMGYWVQADIDITQHPGVKFSHGFCPECRDLHYPAFNNKK